MGLQGYEVLQTCRKAIIRNIRIYYMNNDLSGGIPCKYVTYVLKFPKKSWKMAQISNKLIINLIFIFSIFKLNIF